MSRHIFVVCFVLLSVGGGFGTVWEFGQDRHNSVVIAYNDGKMCFLQKTKYIPITVPQCYDVVYVNVEVQNLISTPNVNFMKENNTVAIYYKMLQNSLSQYKILVKGLYRNKCKVGEMKPREKNYQPVMNREEIECEPPIPVLPPPPQYFENDAHVNWFKRWFQHLFYMFGR